MVSGLQVGGGRHSFGRPGLRSWSVPQSVEAKAGGSVPPTPIDYVIVLRGKDRLFFFSATIAVWGGPQFAVHKGRRKKIDTQKEGGVFATNLRARARVRGRLGPPIFFKIS